MNILQWISQTVGATFDAIVGGVAEIVGWLMAINDTISTGFLVVLSLAWFALVYFFDCLNWLNGHLPSILAMIQGQPTVTGTVIPGGLQVGFDICNTIIPLTEAFGFLAFVLPLWVTCVLFRAIKSWLPTIN